MGAKGVWGPGRALWLRMDSGKGHYLGVCTLVGRRYAMDTAALGGIMLINQPRPGFASSAVASITSGEFM